jgi:hypothetical protein
MDKKRLHHLWRRLRPIKPRYFLLLAVIFAGLSVYGLRANNLHMVELRDKVFQADKDNGDTETALRNLRQYVYGHMNTSLTSGNSTIYPPIQLRNSYDRAIAAQKAANPDTNSQIYIDAQKECEKEFPRGLSGSGRIPCIQEYIASHGIQKQDAIPASLYEFDFVSPRWSPDLAGWSLVATTLCLAMAGLSFVTDRWVKIELRD